MVRELVYEDKSSDAKLQYVGLNIFHISPGNAYRGSKEHGRW